MNRILSSAYLLLILFSFSACEKTIDVVLPKTKDQVVLNALMNEDSLIYAHLSKLNHNLSPTFTDQEADEVMLFENGVFKETLLKEQRNQHLFYKSNTKAILGNTYKIVAKISGSEVEGEDTIPQIAKITATSIKHITTEDDEYIENKFHFTIQDQPNVTNYYRVRILDQNKYYDDYTSRFTVDEDTEGALNIYREKTSFFFDDAIADGREISYTLNLSSTSIIDSAIVEITSLTKTSYLYLKSAYNAREKSTNPFVEATPIYNNIKNGLGVVGGISVNKVIIK